jgi:hypothetical protein
MEMLAEDLFNKGRKPGSKIWKRDAGSVVSQPGIQTFPGFFLSWIKLQQPKMATSWSSQSRDR